MPRNDAEAELRARKRMEEEVNVLGNMVDDTSKGRPSESKGPKVILQYDMWPPLFMAGTACKVRFVSCEHMDRGRFILVRYKGQIHVVRFISWKFAGGKTSINFIPGPHDHRVVTSSDLELLGEVVSVVDKATGKEINPNKTGFFRRVWDTLTTYGTGGFWKGLYDYADNFVIDTSSVKREQKRHTESVFQTWNKLESWRQDVEARKEVEEAQRAARQKGKKKRWNDLEFEDDSIGNLPDEQYDVVKEKLAKTTDAEMAAWWTPDERMGQARNAATAPRPRRRRK